MSATELRARKLAVTKSLRAIGESDIAADFEEATEATSFESVELVLRNRLAACNNRKRGRVLANAIVEAQCLPTLYAQEK